MKHQIITETNENFNWYLHHLGGRDAGVIGTNLLVSDNAAWIIHAKAVPVEYRAKYHIS